MPSEGKLLWKKIKEVYTSPEIVLKVVLLNSKVMQTEGKFFLE